MRKLYEFKIRIDRVDKNLQSQGFFPGEYFKRQRGISLNEELTSMLEREALDRVVNYKGLPVELTLTIKQERGQEESLRYKMLQYFENLFSKH